MYREVATGKLYTMQELSVYMCAGFPADGPSDNWLDTYGFVRVISVTVPPTVDELCQQVVYDLENYYDTKAREKQYDSRVMCVMRAGYAGPYQAECTAFAIWMDTCNVQCYQILNNCKASSLPIPSAIALIADLPVLAW